MAEIFVASAPGERDPVVIKVISRERATDEKFVQMFLDEARLVATLNHPNIARLLEVGAATARSASWPWSWCGARPCGRS
ncbi:MAG: hypothetical protein HS111_01170 [Kofleriaceae bacterium]|nr:hypothetical protein [Kofleriaceae bacterium]